MHGIIDRIDTQHSFGTEGLMTSEESLEIETVASVAATTDSKPGEETIADNVSPLHHLADLRHDPDAIRHLFESREYPYKRKISRREYKKHKVELLKVQDWVKATGQKVIILFEGRDAAGKGGTIKRFTEHLNPRSARVVALEKPTEKERKQWFFSVILWNCPPPAKWFCLIVPGTTVHVSNA